jgi:hypothetical protein
MSIDTCFQCHRPAVPPPMNPIEAAQARNLTKKAGLEDRFAYAYAKSTVLRNAMNEHLLCKCDIANWDAALLEYDTKGAVACWKELGVE